MTAPNCWRPTSCRILPPSPLRRLWRRPQRYPHLAKGKYPVPGYVTVFPMYDTVEYALPGEVEQEDSQARERFIPARPAR